jgi:hypothetical protein
MPLLDGFTLDAILDPRYMSQMVRHDDQPLLVTSRLVPMLTSGNML